MQTVSMLASVCIVLHANSQAKMLVFFFKRQLAQLSSKSHYLSKYMIFYAT